MPEEAAWGFAVLGAGPASLARHYQLQAVEASLSDRRDYLVLPPPTLWGSLSPCIRQTGYRCTYMHPVVPEIIHAYLQVARVVSALQFHRAAFSAVALSCSAPSLLRRLTRGFMTHHD
jgi:hypothetical protein